MFPISFTKNGRTSRGTGESEELDKYVLHMINYIKNVYNTKQPFPWTNSGRVSLWLNFW